MQDDLTNVRDDMTAFIEGQGMRRFHAYVGEDVQSIVWDANENPEGWKDFVELAKFAGASFLTMSDVSLEREDLDYLIERLRSANFPDDEDIEEARWLRTYVGKTGFVQLGWAYQGTIFLYEVSSPWYDRYQRLVDVADEVGGIIIDEPDQDDEH